jgi:hypothetical protein
VIVDVFVAQCQPIDPLGQHLRHRVINKYLLALVFKTLGQRQGQAQVGIHLPQQQYTPITGERATGKIGYDLARIQVLKQQPLFLTVCRTRSGDWCFHLAR